MSKSSTTGPPNNGHFGASINSADLFFVEVFLFGKFTMYCRNYSGTVSCFLCREV